MNLSHLTDDELIDYVVKHDDDPIRVRLATYMQRKPGAIIDDLGRAGMDETFCTFKSKVTYTEYLPGEYISHLEGEIEYIEEQLKEAQDELYKLQTRTVATLIEDLSAQLSKAEFRNRHLESEREAAKKNEQIMKEKLDMWAILNR